MAKATKRAKAKAKAAPVSKADSRDQEAALKRKPVLRWIQELEKSGKMQKDWEDKCDKIVARYIDDRDSDGSAKGSRKNRKYNALWSVMQTLMPLTYSSPPKPYISRRFGDQDPVARDASEILQRALTYSVESECLHDSLDDANEDFNLTSRTIIWTRYSPLFSLRETDDRCYVEDGEELPEDVDEDDLEEDEKGTYYAKKAPTKVDEELDVDHVLYSDFRHGAASKWRYVPWAARRVPMTRAKLVERFGEKGQKPPLTIDCNENTKDATDDEKGLFAKAEIWEIWSKIDRKVYWVCPQWSDDFLDTVDDPLELDGFFPCPRPAYGTKTNKSLIPQPDYLLWQDVALELDDITARIKLLTEALRVVGLYDKQMGDVVKRLTSQTAENDMIPVDSWAMMQERGGLKNAVEFFPIDQVMIVLDKLQQRRSVLVQELYEITGVSDIIRGASDPNETLGAQKLKGNYANKRLGKRQDKIARMAREELEIMAQIICQHYSEDTLMRISSAEQWMKDANGIFDVKRFANAIALLRVGMLRRLRIKIDERSLAAQDLDEDRSERMAFLQAVAQLITGFAALSQQLPGGQKLLSTLLMFGVRAFPMARTTEAEFEVVLKQLAETAEHPQQQDQKPEAAPQGKTPEELNIEMQKVNVQSRRVDAMFAEVKRKTEDDLRSHSIAIKELQARIEEMQKDAMIREAKVFSDVQLKQQQQADTRQQMQHQAQQDRQRLDRDLSNDRMAAVQAFSAPRQQRAA